MIFSLAACFIYSYNYFRGVMVMRDQERIEMYYKFGTIDNYSEKHICGGKIEKGYICFTPVRYFKLANLLWSAVLKNMSAEKRK